MMIAMGSRQKQSYNILSIRWLFWIMASIGSTKAFSRSPWQFQCLLTQKCNPPRMSVGDYLGLEYDEPLFRPPAEAGSLILQVTIGCSWNRCTFCEMYQTKNFRARKIDELKEELDFIVESGEGGNIRKVFLADGDAMTLPTGMLVEICSLIKASLPNVRRISSYCLPRNVRGKSVEDLRRIAEAGLSLVYVGCESGCDQVLLACNKGETFQSSVEALGKLRAASIKTSIMILMGLGGKALSEEHARQSAYLVNAGKPNFLSTLVVSFPLGQRRVQAGFTDQGVVDFEALSPRETLEELELFLTEIDETDEKLQKTIFRSDHASNYFVVKGTLKEKKRMVGEVRRVLNSPESEDGRNLRPEWMRGL